MADRVSDSSGSDLLWSGEKQTTRLVPRALCARNSESVIGGASGVSAISAAKSFVKTKVRV